MGTVSAAPPSVKMKKKLTVWICLSTVDWEKLGLDTKGKGVGKGCQKRQPNHSKMALPTNRPNHPSHRMISKKARKPFSGQAIQLGVLAAVAECDMVAAVAKGGGCNKKQTTPVSKVTCKSIPATRAAKASHWYRPGTVALCEICHYQKTAKLLI